MKSKIHEYKKNNITAVSKKLLLLLLTTFTLSCCNKDDDKPKTELEKLPPATQTGVNTAGCLVNGQAFLPKGYFSFGNLSCNYTDGLNFNLRISEKINDNIRSIYVFNDNQPLEVGVTYLLKQNLNNNTLPYSYATYTDFNNMSGGDFITTDMIIGELKITNHNFSGAILSGTFWFDAVNNNGEKIEVREGRFDMHY